jgi:hypothetical protein
MVLRVVPVVEAEKVENGSGEVPRVVVLAVGITPLVLQHVEGDNEILANHGRHNVHPHGPFQTTSKNVREENVVHDDFSYKLGEECSSSLALFVHVPKIVPLDVPNDCRKEKEMVEVLSLVRHPVRAHDISARFEMPMVGFIVSGHIERRRCTAEESEEHSEEVVEYPSSEEGAVRKVVNAYRLLKCLKTIQNRPCKLCMNALTVHISPNPLCHKGNEAN